MVPSPLPKNGQPALAEAELTARKVTTDGTTRQLRSSMYREKARTLVGNRYFVPACLISGGLLRLIWVSLLPANQVFDFAWYYHFAENIISGRGYSANGVPTAYWPVGYPGFLAGIFYFVGPHEFVGKLANIVLDLGAIFLAYRFSKKVFHSESAARITVMILAFYPNHIAYTSLLASEPLFVFLFLLAAILFIAGPEHLGFLALSGIVWGLATLTKTQALLIPIIFIPVFLRTRQSIVRAAVTTYVMVFLVLTPWL